MTDTLMRAARVAVDNAISENIAVLMHRTRTNQRQVAEVLGVTKASISRKLVGGPWHYAEMLAVCDAYGVTVEELAGTLPSLDVWRARRDSNPKPSVPLFIVKSALTPESPVIQERNTDPVRHLRAV